MFRNHIKNITLLIALFIGTSINAQSKVKIGLEIGPSITGLRGNQIVDQNSSLFGYAAGVSVEFLVSKNVSLKGNFFFERKGTRVKEGETFAPMTNIPLPAGKSNYDYITIPLILKYKFDTKPVIYANAGPYRIFIKT